MVAVYTSLNHPKRVALAAEAHSRPFLHLTAPESLSHLAVYLSDENKSNGTNSNGNRHAADQHALLADLCRHFGVASPGSEAKHFYHDFGRFRLKWECHTEFATYTFAQKHETQMSIGESFSHVPLTQIPQEWLASLKGKVLVAAHVVLEKGMPDSDDSHRANNQVMRQIFEGQLLASSKVLQGGEIWTDFLIQADGFSRFVVRDIDLRDMQNGRLVQRILEIETYRMMALLGLPHAQQAVPTLNAIEGDLAALTVTMVDSDKTSIDADHAHTQDGQEQDERILRKITDLAARMEKISLENNYRFSASQAYFQLVQSRIEELREIRIEGVPTIGEFMDRRLAPAMHTCAAVARRQEALAERIAHTNDLLRTRVDIVQEQQNRKILQSMNARAARQLQLQQSVEGLSVAAISYYMVGLFSYTGKAMKAAGWPINPDIATGIVVPLFAAAVWLGLRRLHKHMPGE